MSRQKEIFRVIEDVCQEENKQSDLSSSVSHVFFVTSWGYAADHWFAWFVKALNAHPEMLAYLANEGSRPKYYPEERSRSERPDIVKFTQFLADVGMTYTAIGDCYSYRVPMMKPVFEKWGEVVPVLHLTRHPYAWLRFYVQWRANNMRMAEGRTGPLEHEWNVANHELFGKLGLMPYEKKDVEVWASYQGMLMLNGIISDAQVAITCERMENVVNNPEQFARIVQYLTHGRVVYEKSLLAKVYSWVWTPFRGEGLLRIVPEEEHAAWPDWKREAFYKIVREDAIDLFRQLGYEL